MEAAATRAYLYCTVSTPHASHLTEGKFIGISSRSGEGDPRASGNINSLPPPRSAPAILPPLDLHLDTAIPPPPNPDLVLAQQLLDRIHADAQLQRQQQQWDGEVVLLWLRRRVCWIHRDLPPQQQLQRK